MNKFVSWNLQEKSLRINKYKAFLNCMERYLNHKNHVIASHLKNLMLKILNSDIYSLIHVKYPQWLIPSVIQYIVTIMKIDDRLKEEIDHGFWHVNHYILVEEKLLSIILNFDLMYAINDKHANNVLIRHEVNKQIWLIKFFLVKY